jgi:hypothetical protein
MQLAATQDAKKVVINGHGIRVDMRERIPALRKNHPHASSEEK